LPVSWPNAVPIGSGRKMYSPRIPHAMPNEISRKGVNERNWTRNASGTEVVGGMSFFLG
jgi:hypothetical protein